MTQIQFCFQWDAEQIRVLTSLRKRKLAGMELLSSPRYDASLGSPASPAQAALMEHELISTQEVRLEVMAGKRSRELKEKAGGARAKRGVCCLVGKGCLVTGSGRTHFKCLQCGGKAGSYYHAFCFARQHTCSLR